MSQQERFEYLLSVRDEANPAIKQTGDNAATLGGKASTAAKGIDSLEHSVGKLRTSVAVSAGSLDAYTKKTMSLGEGVKGLQARMGPAAGAVAGLSAAMGQQGGEAGKALAAVGQLAAAFAVGGPFMLAVTAGTLALDMFFASKAKDEAALKAIEDRATALREVARLAKDAAFAEAGVLQREVAQLEGINELKRRGFDDEARRFAALGALQTRYFDQVKAIAANTNAEVAGTMKQQLKAIGMQLTSTLEIVNLEIKGDAAAESRQKAQDDFQARVTSWNKSREADETRYLEQVKERIAAEVEAAGAAQNTTTLLSRGLRGEVTAAPQAGGLGAEMRLARDAARDAARQAEQDALDDADLLSAVNDDVEVQAARLIGDLRLEQQQVTHDAMIENERAFQSEMAGIAMTGASIVAGVAQQFIADRIAGEEHAAEKLGLAFMAQAGQALVGYGTQLGGLATVSALSGLLPLAAAQGAGGVALIGAGVGLGGVATGLSTNLAASEADAAKRLAADERGREARTSNGAGGSLGSAGSRGGGGTQITIVYGGVSGPEAESGARAIAKGLQLANDRGRITKRIERR